MQVRDRPSVLRASRWSWIVAAAALGAGLGGCASSSFDWDVSPDKATVAPGGVATFDIVIRSKHNIDSKVFLRVDPVPPSIQATLDPEALPGTDASGTLTLQTEAATPETAFELRVFAREDGYREDSREVTLIVSTSQGQPGFLLSVDPAEYTFESDSAQTFAFFVLRLNGFNGLVQVELTGLTDDYLLVGPVTPTAVTFEEGGPSRVGGTFVLRFLPNPPVDDEMVLTLTASGGGITHALAIRIVPPQATSAPAAPSAPGG